MLIWLFANWEMIAGALTAVAAVANNIKDRGTMKQMSEMFVEQEQPNSAILKYARDTAKDAAYKYLAGKFLNWK